MNDSRPRAHPRNLESAKKEAKRWLQAIENDLDDARDRFARAVNHPPHWPTLREVQHALAREYGFAGWSALSEALSPDAETTALALAQYEEKARALLDAYQTGAPDALERHYALTWHRRPWHGMRSYVQLDLGKRPANADDPVNITIDDARFLVAIEHGFENWTDLTRFAVSMPSGLPTAASPVRVRSTAEENATTFVTSRDWGTVLSVLAANPGATLDAGGQMTDEILEQVSRIDHIAALQLGNSKALTDDGIQKVGRLSQLQSLDLSQTHITDRGLAVLRDLPGLKSLTLTMTSISDEGLVHLRHCRNLERLNVMWTNTGDGALRALAGHANLSHFWSGNLLSDAGLALLHELPVFKTRHHDQARQSQPLELLSYSDGPNLLVLRGAFTDQGMEHMRGLDGVFGLNLDDSALPLTARAMAPLVSLASLGRLSVDAKDDWMPYLAQMPALRFLGMQDTVASDAGFVALSKSQSIEYMWGRRCHGLQGTGFRALANMPRLRGLSVSCLNVDDGAIATLPSFPSLRELMPMDIPDAGYRHIAKCSELEALILMYCRDTTDAATEHLPALGKLKRYFNSYTTITDGTPEILSAMDSLERITFDACHGLTNAGVARLARLPHLRELRVAGRNLSREVTESFAPSVVVHYSH